MAHHVNITLIKIKGHTTMHPMKSTSLVLPTIQHNH